MGVMYLFHADNWKAKQKQILDFVIPFIALRLMSLMNKCAVAKDNAEFSMRKCFIFTIKVLII